MKHILIILLFLYPLTNTFAQSIYDVNKISDDLKKDAIAVVRNEEQFIDVKNIGSAQYEYKIAITVLNKAGDDLAEMEEVYDNFSNISNIKASLYDASGKKIKDYKSADIQDQLASDGFSLFQDNRVKLLKFVSNVYPYTIEYSFTQNFKGLLALPSWRDFKGFGISVEKSTYTIQKNKSYDLKYLTNKGLKTDSLTVGDKTQYIWKSANIPAVTKEPMAVDISNISNWVKASPNQFEYDNTTGSFDSWKNFGSWIYKLNEGGNKLPDVTKVLVQKLIKDAKSPKEKIQILYNYLQQNTRYVSVQLGVGGFRPILAEKVAQVNYGDCKALSNYMKALLNEAGIASNLIVIGNGMPSLNPNYSSIGQANHMILCVPLPKDTTYLECTSQYKPMGFIDYDNSDRDVLMITETGGKIVHTPALSAKDNYQIRKTKINLLEDGTGNLELKSIYSNAQFEDNFISTLMEPVEMRKKILESSNVSIAELIGFKYTQPNKNTPILTEELNFKTNQLLSKGGDKMFLVLNQINRKENVPPKVENRKTSFAVPFSYRDEDEISYHLPKGFKIEFMPKDITIDSEFGTYTAKFILKDNIILYTRTQTMNDKKYPPEKYNEYVDFYKKIYQADKLKAVLSKTIN